MNYLMAASFLLLGAPFSAPAGDRSPQSLAIPNDPLPVLARAADLGPVPRDRTIQISVNLAYGRPAEARRYADAVSDPKSPLYRRFLEPLEIGERFGVSDTEIDAVVAHLRGHGLQIDMAAKHRLAVLAVGTVEQVEHAFDTDLRDYAISPANAVEPSRFYAYSRPLRLPADLARIVVHVGGLETYTRPERRVDTLSPAQAATLYDAAGLHAGGFLGQGRTIGVSSFDGFRAADYVQFVNHFGLPTPSGGAGSNITVIPCNGGGTGAGTANAEGDLDIQMELGQAPLANIRVYDAPANNDLMAVLSTEANDNACDVISESYGWFFTSPSSAVAAHDVHVTMTMEGITYMAASGDHGTALEPYSYPDYEPEVLSIGGTTASTDSTGNRQTESGWTMGGGGFSTNTVEFNVRPAWQTGTGVPAVTPLNDHRLVPDVAFHSAGQDGNAGAYYFYTGGALSSGYIGTSFASPVFAGLLAIVEQKIIVAYDGLSPNAAGKRRFGRIQDYVYSQDGRPDVWHDITSGQNGVCPDGTPSIAAAGWDTATGWGAMDCAAFVPIAACDTGGSCGEGIPFCAGDGIDSNVTTNCPCLNFGAPGHGCDNSSATGGAILSASGTTSPDTIVMTSSGEKPTAFSLLLQGTTSVGGGVLYGDGVRCIGGTFKRLFAKNAVAGVFTAPTGSDPSIKARSAALGDVIPPGATRYYQVSYRDPASGFCPSGTFNVSSGWIVTWN